MPEASDVQQFPSDSPPPLVFRSETHKGFTERFLPDQYEDQETEPSEAQGAQERPEKDEAGPRLNLFGAGETQRQGQGLSLLKILHAEV